MSKPTDGMSRREWLQGVGACSVAGALAAPLLARAQTRRSQANWPRKSIRFLVGFPAGTSPDLMARALAEPLGQLLGQPVIVENRVGASGSIATEALARASDEHTLGIVGNAALTSNLILNPTLHYSLSELRTITVVGSAPSLIISANSVAFGNPAEFFHRAKEAGTKWSYGSVGIGSASHLLAELLKEKAGFEAVHVPFNGSPAILNAMMAGDVQMATLPIGFALAQVQAGNVRAVAVTSTRRTTLAPQVPALPEAGIPGLDIEGWNALVVPASLPTPIVEIIASAASRIIRSEEMRRKLFQQGWVADGTAPEAALRRIRDDTAIYRQIIERRKITLAG